MTIRYTCEKCGSVLKIKDDRAGKDGHCPKCKASFVVPPPDALQPVATTAADDDAAAPAEAARLATPVIAAKSTAAPVAAAKAAAAAEDADFDPVAFLMTDGDQSATAAPAKAAAARGGDSADMRIDRAAGPAVYSASDEPDVRVGAPRGAPTADADDDSAAESLRRKPKRAAAPPSAAQTADEMLRVNASSNAKDLLTRTMEESRIRAAQMPEDRKKPGIDYKEAARELATRFAPAVVGFVLLIVGLYWLGNYMVGGGPDLPELGYVTGTVTKGGEPLVDAQVTFTPVDADASGATAYTDEYGNYELKYTEGVPGAVLGKNRVEVSKIGPDGREQVPAKTEYGLGSNIVETIKEGSQTINIQIPARPAAGGR